MSNNISPTLSARVCWPLGLTDFRKNCIMIHKGSKMQTKHKTMFLLLSSLGRNLSRKLIPLPQTRFHFLSVALILIQQPTDGNICKYMQPSSLPPQTGHSDFLPFLLHARHTTRFSIYRRSRVLTCLYPLDMTEFKQS